MGSRLQLQLLLGDSFDLLSAFDVNEVVVELHDSLLLLINLGLLDQRGLLVRVVELEVLMHILLRSFLCVSSRHWVSSNRLSLQLVLEFELGEFSLLAELVAVEELEHALCSLAWT